MDYKISRGRPKNLIWDSYRTIISGIRKVCICKRCKKQVSPTCERLKAHLSKCTDNEGGKASVKRCKKDMVIVCLFL